MGTEYYFGHILGFNAWIRQRKWLKINPDVDSFYDKVTSTAWNFESGLQEVIGSNPYRDVEGGLTQHYASLKEIVEIYKRGLKLKQKYPDVPELDRINQDLRRQIVVTNILFDPKKRTREFRHLMWADPEVFGSYLDSVSEV